MNIILKNSVEITKQSMFRCIITTITQINTSYKGSDFSIITMGLSINKNTFLMVCKHVSNYLLQDYKNNSAKKLKLPGK